MNMQSNIQPISNVPALFILDKKILVVADLHIGIESELSEHGLHTNSQTKKMVDRLLFLLEKYNPSDVVLLGDIKHTIPSSTIMERRDIRKFFETIKSFGIIHVVPGNHDGNISKLAPDDVLVHSSDGFVINNIGFVHGHRWPKIEIMQCDQVIFGHTHPTIMLTDRLGFQSFEPCWLRGSFNKDKLLERYSISNNPDFIMMPAFNPLCGGSALNKDGIVGPFSNIIDVDSCQVYLLDGSSLGIVKDIQ